MHDDVADDSDATLDRRALIKKIGVAGAVAWTAPVVMDSVLSPAAAQSAPGGPGGPSCAISYFEGFEGVDATANGNYSTYASTLTGATGWSVAAGSVDAVVAPDYSSSGFTTGTTVIELGGSGNVAGTLTRTVSVPCNQEIDFSFDWSNPSAHNTVVTLTQGGNDLMTPFTLTPQGNENVSSFSDSGIAVLAGSVTITFTASGTDNSGALIDNVLLQSSP